MLRQNGSGAVLAEFFNIIDPKRPFAIWLSGLVILAIASISRRQRSRVACQSVAHAERAVLLTTFVSLLRRRRCGVVNDPQCIERARISDEWQELRQNIDKTCAVVSDIEIRCDMSFDLRFAAAERDEHAER